jgi:hypothetical protein
MPILLAGIAIFVPDNRSNGELPAPAEPDTSIVVRFHLVSRPSCHQPLY